MSSGLPTFATCYGGPSEIIEDGISGFHLDPNHGDEAMERMVDYMAACRNDPSEWDRVSRAGLDRVATRYTWELYARRLLSLSRIYGFWKYITNMEREETRRYLEMFYGLMFKARASLVNGQATPSEG
jgi:sucrose synthase